MGADVFHTIYDSVTALNGITDANPLLAAGSTYFFTENATGSPVPFGTSFENPADTSYYATDFQNDGNTWGLYWSGASTSLAHTGIYAEGAILMDCQTGEKNILVLPEIALTDPAGVALDFYEAYAQQDSSSNDLLEVVYSTDCGTTWTSVWSMAGSEMATMPADATHVAVPTSPSQYRRLAAGLGNIPAGDVMPGFRFTQDGGNAIWIDDINIHVATATRNLANIASDINLYPNPAGNETTLSFNLDAPSNVRVEIIDELGRTISVVADGNMNMGANKLIINTEAIPAGVYCIVMQNERGRSTKRLSVMK